MDTVSPEEIGAVAQTWAVAARDPDRLHNAIADRLPGAPRNPAARAERARWIVDAVTRVSPALDHPTTLESATGAVIARRAAVTTAELAADRDALVGALRAVAEGFGPAEEQAWDAAFQLFSEVVAVLCLDPFGARRQPDRRSQPLP
jgi:hypothetical protein